MRLLGLGCTGIGLLKNHKPLSKAQGTSSSVQWYLTQPFCSCEQHQSFLESDHPCIQLENPASQS